MLPPTVTLTQTLYKYIIPVLLHNKHHDKHMLVRTAYTPGVVLPVPGIIPGTTYLLFISHPQPAMISYSRGLLLSDRVLVGFGSGADETPVLLQSYKSIPGMQYPVHPTQHFYPGLSYTWYSISYHIIPVPGTRYVLTYYALMYTKAARLK